MSESMMKTCTKCKKEKELSCFVKDRGQETKMCDSCREKHIKYNNKRKCEHGRKKYQCKECKGDGICQHNRRKTDCKECRGSSICEHNRYKNQCKDCKGSSICEHNKVRTICKDCGGGSICEHNRKRTSCKDCKGGSICEHDKRKSRCKNCGGSEICEHNKQRAKCKTCDPLSHLTIIVRSSVYKALKGNKTKPSMEYLQCSSEELKKHLEEQFVEGMTWENYGSEWHVDHIIPLFYENPTIEEITERLHYTNTQPLWAEENLSKGNRYIG